MVSLPYLLFYCLAKLFAGQSIDWSMLFTYLRLSLHINFPNDPIGVTAMSDICAQGH